jgi:osmotically inducible protein OsmC
MADLYKTTFTATGGREGRAVSADGRIVHNLSLPKELGGPGGDGTNPEQLFAAGYAACFESALRLVARMQKIPLKDASITATVSLFKTPDGKYQLGVDLLGKLGDLPKDAAEALMKTAHTVCPYSRATQGNIEVSLRVE